MATDLVLIMWATTSGYTTDPSAGRCSIVLREDMGYTTPSTCGPYVLGSSLCVCARV